MATFIASTARSSLHSLAWQGFLPSECHEQLATLIRAELSEPHALLLAMPVFDPDRVTVDWYTKAEGPVTSLTALPAEEQDSLRARIAELGQDLRSAADRLQLQTNAPQRTLGGHLLALALSYPDDGCLYLVGDQPVLTCWGFGPSTQGAHPQDISRPCGPLSAVPTSAVPNREPASVLAASAQPERRRVRWLPWLLPLLLLALLLALLCVGWGGRTPLLPIPGLNLSGPNLFGAKDFPELDIARQQELELLTHISTLRDKANLCARTATPVPEPKKLIIPEQAARDKDMSFLVGVWECETGLRDRNTNTPVTMLYSFDEQGGGFVAVDSAKGICKSGVRATFDAEGRLTFRTDDVIPCPEGTAFSGQEVVCTDKQGEALCSGRNLSSSGQEWSAVFKQK